MVNSMIFGLSSLVRFDIQPSFIPQRCYGFQITCYASLVNAIALEMLKSSIFEELLKLS